MNAMAARRCKPRQQPHHYGMPRAFVAASVRRREREVVRAPRRGSLPELFITAQRIICGLNSHCEIQGSISTPGLSSPCGSSAFLAARNAAANSGGRWRSYHGR